MEIAVFDALRRASEPLSSAQILEQLPPEVLAEFANPRQRLTPLLKRPEVGNAARGRYLYLPNRIAGALFRVPLTSAEFESGLLWFGSEVMFALWFREVDYHWVRPGHPATCELPTREEARLEVSVHRRYRPGLMGPLSMVGADDTLRLWLEEERVRAGDSLLLEILKPDERRCRVTLERREVRDTARIGQRNAELAEAAARVLREEVRGKSLELMGLARWMVALGLYAESCPPDPLELVLDADPRFTYEEAGRVALASKWDWVRSLPGGDLSTEVGNESDFWFPLPLLGGLPGLAFATDLPSLLEGEPGPAEKTADKAADQERERDPEDEEPVDEESLPRLFSELQPWLEANGIPEGGMMLASRGAPGERPELRAARFRFRVTRSSGRGRERTVELEGSARLADLDRKLRLPFIRDDDDDHMSGFFVKLGGDRRSGTLATFDPFGRVHDGQNLELAAMGLEVGDELIYVFDFGAHHEQILRLLEIAAPKRSGGGRGTPKPTGETEPA